MCRRSGRRAPRSRHQDKVRAVGLHITCALQSLKTPGVGSFQARSSQCPSDVQMGDREGAEGAVAVPERERLAGPRERDARVRAHHPRRLQNRHVLRVRYPCLWVGNSVGNSDVW